MTRKLAVLGSPISHSKSPSIHQAAYKVLNLDWEYERFEVLKGGLRNFVESLDQQWLGLSLTMPLKEEAARLAVSLDRAATITGAANTFLRKDDGWHGFNTDVFGIVQAITMANLDSVESVLIIGSGATATSAIAAIRQLAPSAKVSVFARNEKTREELVEFATSLSLSAKSTNNLVKTAKLADLVISTLPAHALDEVASQLAKKKSFKPSGAVMDVAYAPWPSEFAKIWHEKERPIISGLEMLLWQAIAQIRIFTSGDIAMPLHNEVAVVEAMRHAL